MLAWAGRDADLLGPLRQKITVLTLRVQSIGLIATSLCHAKIAGWRALITYQQQGNSVGGVRMMVQKADREGGFSM